MSVVQFLLGLIAVELGLILYELLALDIPRRQKTEK